MPEAGMQVKADAARAEIVARPRPSGRCCRGGPPAARDGSPRSARRRSLRQRRRRSSTRASCSAGDELAMHVAPFGQAQIRHEMRAACSHEPPMRQLRGQRVAEEFPQREQRQEIRALVAKAQVRLVGGLRACRADARADRAPTARSRSPAFPARQPSSRAAMHHAADARIERQSRELAAERRQRVARVDRVELLQQLIAIGDGARAAAARGTETRRRRPGRATPCAGSPPASELRRISGSVYAGRAAKSSSAYRRTQMPFCDAAAAARALLRRGLRDLLDLQQRHLVAQRVALDAREARCR